MYRVKGKQQLDLEPRLSDGPHIPNGTGSTNHQSPDKPDGSESSPPGSTRVRDEVQEYVEARYCSTSEACWRTFELPMSHLHPRVQRLPVHLSDKQTVLFTNNKEKTQEALQKARSTMLTAFFFYVGKRKK